MKAVRIAQDVIEDVYGSIYIPGIHHPDFLQLITGTRRLIELTLSGEHSSNEIKALTITHVAESMASTDENRVVSIPAWYCIKTSLEKFLNTSLTDKQASAVALTLVNGSSIHEALHVAYTDYLFRAQKSGTLSMPNEALMQYLLNLTEDLKNEKIIEPRWTLNRFIEAKNDIFFSEERYNRSLDTAYETYGNSDGKSIACEMLLFYKSTKRRQQIDELLLSYGLSEVVSLLQQCFHVPDIIRIARRLYEIFDDCAASKTQSQSQGELEGLVKSAIEAIESEMRKEAKGKSEVPVAMMTINMETDKNGIPPIRIIDVMDDEFAKLNRAAHIYYEKTTIDFGFIKKLRLVRQVVPTVSEPRKSGTKLVNTRIHKIATDGKMFAIRGDSVASIMRKQPEFIIVVDASGSMRDIISRVMSFVRKLSAEMLSIGVSFSVVAHTSFGDDDAPVLYHIFTHKMNGKSDAEFQFRFEAARNFVLAQNLDGIALEAASKGFGRGKQGIMLVLSDGSPSSPNYDNGIEHTRNTVKKLRKSGIKVISLSLKGECMHANNHIYGSDNNIDATSQTKLENGMMKLIMG